MPLPRIMKSSLLFVLLTGVTILISGIVAASPEPSTEQDQVIPQRPPQPYTTALEMLSPDEGIDFGPYLSALHHSIKHNLLSKIPKSASEGLKGIVVVRFQILKDGTLLDKSITIVSGSGRKDMDEAAVSVIRSSAPFGGVPDKYSGPTVDLKYFFFYNTVPDAPFQKPKTVPQGPPRVIPIGI
jgi:TonB family protein